VTQTSGQGVNVSEVGVTDLSQGHSVAQTSGQGVNVSEVGVTDLSQGHTMTQTSGQGVNVSEVGVTDLSQGDSVAQTSGQSVGVTTEYQGHGSCQGHIVTQTFQIISFTSIFCCTFEREVRCFFI
jgi:hypothetical protein